jgi:hypothetical protein
MKFLSGLETMQRASEQSWKGNRMASYVIEQKDNQGLVKLTANLTAGTVPGLQSAAANSLARTGGPLLRLFQFMRLTGQLDVSGSVNKENCNG